MATALLLGVAGCGGGSTTAAVREVIPRPLLLDCRDGGPAAAVQSSDVRVGPLAILDARRTPRQRRDGFGGLGWKAPTTLPAGATVTLSFPPRLRGRVGLVYTLETQSRVGRRGVRAADDRVTFSACAGEGAPGRTGWPGGIVVDRRRCVTLRATVAGGTAPIERRVPLGRRCG